MPTPASAYRKKPTIWASVNRFFIVRSLLLGPDAKPKRYSESGGRQTSPPHSLHPKELTCDDANRQSLPVDWDDTGLHALAGLFPSDTDLRQRRFGSGLGRPLRQLVH